MAVPVSSGGDVPGGFGAATGGRIGEEEGDTALAKFDGAGLQVGVVGDDKAVLLDLGDEAEVEQVVNERALFFDGALIQVEGGGEGFLGRGGGSNLCAAGVPAGGLRGWRKPGRIYRENSFS